VDSIVANVLVDPVGSDALVIEWELQGAPIAVDVAMGTSVDHLDHQFQVTVPAGKTSLGVMRRPGGRQFISVAPHGGGPAVVAAERRIPLESVTNFRDLGGYRTRSGRRVRWGQVFRSDALHGMSDGDLAVYSQLGLRAVYDLRREAEITERPDPVPSRNLPILSRPADDETPVTRGATTGEDAERVLLGLYLGHIDHAATRFGELFCALAEDDGLPALFHCHGGKDRTALAAALLLEALGVERQAILDDYELTARYWQRDDQVFERLMNAGLPPEAAVGVLSAPRWVLVSALEYLDRDYNGIEPYLTGPGAMRSADLRRLSDRLLTPLS
jgi:protein-tyrosine phosphatase